MNDFGELPGLQKYPLARRGLMMSSLMTGLTLATTRVEAQVIHTDSAGIEAGEVKIPSGDVDLPGYFAKPQGAGPFPIVVVNEEIFGLHDYIMDICRRLAKAGYAAVAPEIYARVGDLSKLSDMKQIGAIVASAPDATIMSDLDHAVTYAAAHGGDANRLGTIGFCQGGRTVWLFAAHSPALKAAVAFYGPVLNATSEAKPQTAMDLAAEIKCPLLCLDGAADTFVKVPDVQAAAAKARAAGKTVDVVVYPDAVHGFHADYRPSYNAEAAADGWKRMLAWFKQYGVA